MEKKARQWLFKWAITKEWPFNSIKVLKEKRQLQEGIYLHSPPCPGVTEGFKHFPVGHEADFPPGMRWKNVHFVAISAYRGAGEESS